MAIVSVPRTDRRLVNVPEVRTFRDNPGERWGVLADTARNVFGGAADGIDAIGRARLAADARARSAEARAKADERARSAESDETASLLASRYRAHARQGWNGYLTRDADGNEVRVPGAGEKTYADYADGESTLSDIEAIDAAFREREDYRAMDAATREAFERKIAPARDEMMQLAQRKAYADRVAKGKAEFDERVQEWALEVETTFGGDDAAYDAASEQCSVREAIATFGRGEVANAAELDAKGSVSVEDVRFANDPTGAKQRRLAQLVEAKRGVYDRRYFDTLVSAGSAGQAVGSLKPEDCIEKAAKFAAGMAKTDAEKAALLQKVDKARIVLAAVRAEERGAAIRENREESAKRQDEFYKGIPEASAFPAFLDSEADAAEKAGDYARATDFREKSARMRAAVERSGREAIASGLEERRRREEIELYRDGRQPTLEEKREFDVRWQRIYEKSDAKSALAHAKNASGLSDAMDVARRRAREEELARNNDRLEWMLIREQSLRASGRASEANELRQDIGFEFAALKAECGISASDVKSFEREFAAGRDADSAALVRLFDDAFEMTLDEDDSGDVSASEMRAFRDSGDSYEPKWAKGDSFDARTRLRLRREYLFQIASLPPDIDRREAAKAVLKQFEARYVKGRYEDQISYMADLFTDLRTGVRRRYADVRASRASEAARRESERRRSAESVYATPEAAEKLDRGSGAEDASGIMRGLMPGDIPIAQ